MNDPMTGYEQHEAEQAEKFYETRYENDWAEAVEAARERVGLYIPSYVRDHAAYIVAELLNDIWAPDGPSSGTVRCLRDFNVNHGTPALLRVIAQAIELETGK